MGAKFHEHAAVFPRNESLAPAGRRKGFLRMNGVPVANLIRLADDRESGDVVA